MLRVVVEAAGPTPFLADIRLLVVCLVAFEGFIQCNKLIKLRCNDTTFNDQGVLSNKTDQTREGSSLVIARTGTVTCPVAMMERYYAIAGIKQSLAERLSVLLCKPSTWLCNFPHFVKQLLHSCTQR